MPSVPHLRKQRIGQMANSDIVQVANLLENRQRMRHGMPETNMNFNNSIR
jgi:hypothetical protein